jgi:hypothetical protein
MFEEPEFLALVSAWNKAEQYLKIAEQVSDSAIVPGVNELRYAGRKIIEASQETDLVKQKAILNDAVMDCHRAQHDSIDTAISIINSHSLLMLKKFGIEHVSKAIPEIGKYIGEITDVQKKISASRLDRKNRISIYDTIKDIDLPSIRQNYRNLVSSEPHIKSAKTRERFFQFGGWILAIIAIFVTILVAI